MNIKSYISAILFACAFLALLLGGCKKTSKECEAGTMYEPLDPNVQTFFDNMRQGDTLVFQDQFGNYDTAFYGAKTESWGCEECFSYSDAGRTRCCTKKYNKLAKQEINFKKSNDGVFRISGLQNSCPAIKTVGPSDFGSGIGINVDNNIEWQFKNIKTKAFLPNYNGKNDSTFIISKEYGILYYISWNNQDKIVRKWTRLK